MDNPVFTIIAGHLALPLEKRYRELERLKDLAVFLKAQQLELEKELASLSNEQEAGVEAEEAFKEAGKAFSEWRRKVEESRAKAESVRDQICSAGNPIIYAIRSYFSPYANPPLDQLKARYHKLTRRTVDAEDHMDEARQSYLIAKEAVDSTQGVVDSVKFAIRTSAKNYNDAMESMVAVHKEIDGLIHQCIHKTPVHLLYHYSNELRDFPDLLKAILRLKRMLIWKAHLATYVVPVHLDDADTRFLSDGNDVAMAVESAFGDRKAMITGNIMFTGEGTAHKKKTSRTGNSSRTYWKKIDVSLGGPVQISQNWSYRLWDHRPFAASVASSAHSHFMSGMKRVIEGYRLSTVKTLSEDIAELTGVIRKAWEVGMPEPSELLGEP